MPTIEDDSPDANSHFTLEFSDALPIRLEGTESISLRLKKLPTLDVMHQFSQPVNAVLKGNGENGSLDVNALMSGGVQIKFDDTSSLDVNHLVTHTVANPESDDDSMPSVAIDHAVDHHFANQVTHEHQLAAFDKPISIEYGPKEKPKKPPAICPFRSPSENAESKPAPTKAPPVNHFLFSLAGVVGTGLALLGSFRLMSNHQTKNDISPPLNSRSISAVIQPSPLQVLNNPYLAPALIAAAFLALSLWVLYKLIAMLFS